MLHSQQALEAARVDGIRAVEACQNRPEPEVSLSPGRIGCLSCSRPRRRPGCGHLHGMQALLVPMLERWQLRREVLLSSALNAT